MQWILVFFLLLIHIPSAQAEESVSLRPYQRELSFTGFTRPIQDVTLAAEVSGKYSRVMTDVGESIGEDRVVAKLDTTFIELDIKKNQIEQQRTRRQLALENKTIARFSNLISKKSTAQATYDEAVLRGEVLELTLKNLKNEERRLQERLGRHTLYGEVGWQVMERKVEPGEYRRQGEVVFTLGDFRALLVPFLFTFEELRLLKQMEKLPLFLPDLGVEVVAEIHRISPGFDEQRRKISVDLRIPKEEVAAHGELRGGIRCRLLLKGKEESGSYLVPASALVSRYDTSWLKLKDGTQKKVIVLGRNDESGELIVNGGSLQPTDMVLVYPNQEKNMGLQKRDAEN